MLCWLQARQILVQNPQLTKALFQAQILLGMVSPHVPNGASATPPVGLPNQQQQQPPPVQVPPPAHQQVLYVQSA